MTSSFGNVIGTPRDRLPETGDNYARVEPDLTDAVNNEITKQQADTQEFYNQMIEIEKLKQKNFDDNLRGIADLLGTANKFKQQLDADKDAREQIREFRGIYDNRIKANELENALKQGEVLDAQDTAFLLDARKTDRKLQQLLNTKFLTNTEEVSLKELKRKDEVVVGGLGTYALNANLKDKPTTAEAGEVVDRGMQAAVANLFINAKRLGIDVKSREFKLYFTREIGPKLAKKREQLLTAWENDNFRTFETKRVERTDKYIGTELTTAANNYNVNDPSTIVNLNDENTGLLTRLGFDFTDKFETPKDGIDYLVDRVVALANSGDISQRELEFFMQEARFKHSDGRKELVTFKDLGNKSDQSRWGNALENAKKRLNVNESEIRTNITNTLEAKARDLRKANFETTGSSELTDKQREQLISEGHQDARAKGIAVSMAYIPRGISGDETVAASGQSYDSKVGKADPILAKVNLKQNWVQAKQQAGLNVTTISTIEGFEADRAFGDLTQQVEELLSKDKNMTVETAITKVLPKIEEDLFTGTKYKDKYDFLLRITGADIKADRVTVSKDLNAALKNTGFNSIHEKQALQTYAKNLDDGKFGQIPDYFTDIVRTLGITPREYALSRLEATGGLDKYGNIVKNPLEKYALTKEDRDNLLSFPNATKNIAVLNGDGNVTKEAEMLKIFHDAAGNPEDGSYQAPPNRIIRGRSNADEMTVGELYAIAKNGGDKFGRYNFSAQEFIDIVDRAGVDKNATFNEDTQSFMVLGLLRLQANKSNDIVGAITEGRNDWKRLTNLNIQEQEAVLQFFPNLRGMPNNQFQNLQADIAKAILDKVKVYGAADMMSGKPLPNINR